MKLEEAQSTRVETIDKNQRRYDQLLDFTPADSRRKEEEPSGQTPGSDELRQERDQLDQALASQATRRSLSTSILFYLSPFP